MENTILLSFATAFFYFVIQGMMDFSLSKSSFFMIIVGISLFYLIYKYLKEEKVEIVYTKTALVGVLLLGWGLISYIWSASSILTIQKFLFYLPFLFIHLFLLQALNKDNFKDKLLYFLLGIGVFLSTLGILQYIGYHPFLGYKGSGKFVIIGFSGNPNFYATLLIFPMFIALYKFLLTHKPLYIVLFLIHITAIFLTQTRAVWVATFVGLLYMMFWYIKVRNFPKKYIFRYMGISFLIIFILIISILSIPSQREIIYDKVVKLILNPLSDYSTFQRWISWQYAIFMWRSSSIFGKGLGTYRYLAPFYQGELAKNHPEKFIQSFKGIPGHAHNEYLQLLGELGLVGFILFFIAIFYYFKGFVKIVKYEESFSEKLYVILSSTVVVAFLVNIFFSFPFQLTPSFLFFIIAIALIDSKRVNKIVLTHKFIITLLVIGLGILSMIMINHGVRTYIANAYFKKIERIELYPNRFVVLPSGVVMPVELAEGKGHIITKKERSLIVEKNLSKAFSIQPYLPQYKAYIYLAEAYDILGKEEKAIELLYRAIKFTSKANVYYVLGKLERKRKNCKKAVDFLEKTYWALKVNKSLDLYLNASYISFCYYKLGKLDNALWWIKKALKYREKPSLERWKTLENEAIYLYYMKKYEESLKVLEALLKEMEKYKDHPKFGEKEKILYKEVSNFYKKLKIKQETPK